MRKKILSIMLALCVTFVFSTSAALAINITVRIDSQDYSVSIDGSKTVGDLKVKIVSDCDVDVGTLYFNGSEISDGDTLNDLGVSDGSTISDSSSSTSPSPAPAPVTTTKVAKIESKEYETLAAAISAASSAQEAANKAIEVIANTSVSSDLTIPVGVTVTINDGKTLSFSGNARLIVNGTLEVANGGTLDLTGASITCTNDTPITNRPLQINNGGKFEVKGTVMWKYDSNLNDIGQLGTMTIYSDATCACRDTTYNITYTYIGADSRAAITLGENSYIVSTPRDATDYTKGYFYTLNGTATAKGYAITGNDSLIIPSGSIMYVVTLHLSGYKSDQLNVKTGGKILKGEGDGLDVVVNKKIGGEDWKVSSGTFYFDPSKLSGGNYVADGCTVSESNGLYTVNSKPTATYGGSSHRSSTTSELEKAKTEAKSEVKTQSEAQKYDDAEAAEVKAIKEQADKDIAAAKTVEEVNKIKAETEAKIEAVPTAEEKADKVAVSSVSKKQFVATSKKAKLNGKMAVKVSWTLPSGIKVDGFEVYRSTEKNSGFGTEPYFTTTKTSYTNNKELKSGKTYYYKVKGYKMINGEKVYTGWSTKAYRTIK